MQKIVFEKKNLNLFEIAQFVKFNKLNHTDILRQAFEAKVLNDENSNLLLKFINSMRCTNEINSQLYQEMFANFIIKDNYEKTFLEFGATDGVSLSNTYILEKNFNWTGVLSEPSPQWHSKLFNNRPQTKIITDCVWSKSNIDLNFFISEVGVLSTIEEFKESDKKSMPDNTTTRIKKGDTIKVNSISLNDLIEKNFISKPPSYISIDTEGSEYEILQQFDFKKFRPKVFTVEHNFTEHEEKIDNLMKLNNYKRVFRKITLFDAWYVSEEVSI